MTRTITSGTFLLLFMAITATAYAADPFDPCLLLTREEATTLAGEPVKSPEQQESNNPLGQKMCLYETESTSRLIQISIIRTSDIAPQIRKHGQTAAKIYAATKEMLAPLEPIPGIGDDACWGTPGLHILAGETYVLVSVGNTGKRENLELARRIAMKAVPRL